ncbi:MAG: flippase [Gammaproteobacteria bacterium]|nr:flippase [Gammaproteobacteria bacterium]
MRRSDKKPVLNDHFIKKKFVRNIAWHSGGNFLDRLIGLGIAIYLARVLGSEGYGAIGVALAYVSYFAILVESGIEPQGVRDVAQNPDKLPEVFARIIGIRLIFSVVTWLALALSLQLLPLSLATNNELILIYSLSIFVTAATASWAFRGLEKFKIIATVQTCQSIVMGVGIVLFVRGDFPDLRLVPVVYLVSVSVTAVWYYAALRQRFGALTLIFSKDVLLPVFRESLPIALGRFMRKIYSEGNILLMGWLGTAAATGYFLASQKIILSLFVIGVILQQVAFPLISKLVPTQPENAVLIEINLLRYLLLVLTPILVLCAWYADPLIQLIFGSEYSASAPVFFFMLFTLPAVIFNRGLQDLLIARRASRYFLIGNAIGAIFVVGLAIWWIPLYSGVGAALASLVGETVGVVILLVFVRQLFGTDVSLLWVVSIALAAVLMAGVLWLTDTWTPVMQYILAGGSYGIAVLLFKVLSRDELVFMKKHISIFLLHRR